MMKISHKKFGQIFEKIPSPSGWCSVAGSLSDVMGTSFRSCDTGLVRTNCTGSTIDRDAAGAARDVRSLFLNCLLWALFNRLGARLRGSLIWHLIENHQFVWALRDMLHQSSYE